MGVGMLMCGAVGLSPRLPDLPIAAAETVRLAFRFGIFVGDFSRSIEPVIVGDPPKRYVYSIMGEDEATVQKHLDEAQTDEVRLSAEFKRVHLPLTCIRIHRRRVV